MVPPPLALAKLFGVPQIEVAVRIGVTPTWLRHLALRPGDADRVRIAELEAILDHLRARRIVTAALAEARGRS
jgi:hypothetical protein